MRIDSVGALQQNVLHSKINVQQTSKTRNLMRIE